MKLTNDEARELVENLCYEYGAMIPDVSFSDIPEQHPLQGLAVHIETEPCLILLKNNPSAYSVYHEFYHCYAEQRGLPNTENMADSFARAHGVSMLISPTVDDALKIGALFAIAGITAYLILRWKK